MFHGSIVALVTPMHENGSVDFNSLTELIEWQIANKTDAIVVLGTTGESATIHFSEREQVLKTALNQVAGRIPVIAGTGTNCTDETIRLTRHAMEMGVDACLLVTPYYNKPTQEGLYQHFTAVANAVALPQIMYNVPGRTGCDLLPETVCRLTEVTNIIGLKEATGNISRVKEILEKTDNQIDLYSGDDATALDFILSGGKGVISVTANVAPKEMSEMCRAALSNKIDQSKALQNRLMPLHQHLFDESNPIPVKWVLHEMGKIPAGIRLPLTQLASKHHPVLKDAMQEAGIIKEQ